MMDALFSNHLLFIRRHRGDYYAASNSVYITAEAPGFTSWVPLSSDAILPSDFAAVRLLPQSGDAWPDRLIGAGFHAAESLSYQELPLREQLIARWEVQDVTIVCASCRRDALAFADVQSAAFLAGNSAADKWWRAFFPRVALRNYEDPDQDFLLIFSQGHAVAVLLLVHQDQVAGIYAVATRPEYRNKGLSTALLFSAVEQARNRGSERLILQAMVGSFADGFYQRLGFKERYRSQVWRKAEPPIVE